MSSVTVCHVFLCGTSLNWCHGLNVGLLYGSHSLFCKEWTIRYLADPRILYGQCGYPSSPLISVVLPTFCVVFFSLTSRFVETSVFPSVP